MNLPRLKSSDLCACIALLSLSLLLFRFSLWTFDPDTLYHLGVSREWLVRGGWPRVLPQAEDLGWQRFFPEKEFLFHAFTALSFWIGNENGVNLFGALLGSTVILCIYFITRRRLPPLPALLTAALIGSSVFYFLRLSSLKPLALAVLLFYLLALALLKKAPLFAALAAFAYSLAYHAFYMPIALIALHWLCFRSEAEEASARNKTAAMAALGLCGGAALNPYFPAPLVIGWQHLRIAVMDPTLAGLRFGAEVTRFSARDWLTLFPVEWILFGGAHFLFARGRAKLASPEARFWCILTSVLFLGALFSPRLLEFALPALAGFAALTLATVKEKKVWVFLAALLVVRAFTWGDYRVNFRRSPDYLLSQLRHREYIEALLHLPKDTLGKKIFHCNWAAGAYIYYFRPEMRFVDLLDPTFLMLRAPEKHAARERLIAGTDPTPARTIRDTFKADFVLCENPALFQPREKEFRKIYEGRTGIGIYELK